VTVGTSAGRFLPPAIKFTYKKRSEGVRSTKVSFSSSKTEFQLVVDLFHIGPDPDPASENYPDPDPDLTLGNGQPAPRLVLPLP
jgi:hypothetical protein